jgi:hypothetical protein
MEKKKRGDSQKIKAGIKYPHLTKHLKNLRVDFDGADKYLRSTLNSKSRKDQTKYLCGFVNIAGTSSKRIGPKPPASGSFAKLPYSRVRI